MADTTAGLSCATCGRQTLHVDSTRVNHMLHFLLGWLTCSIWWFVWLFITLNHKPTWACSVCGTKSIPPPPTTTSPVYVFTPEERAARDLKNRRVNNAGLAVVVVAGLIAIGLWISSARHDASNATDRMLAALPRGTVDPTSTTAPSAASDGPPVHAGIERALTTAEGRALREYDEQHLELRITSTCTAQIGHAESGRATFNRFIPGTNWPAWTVNAGAKQCIVIDNGHGEPYIWKAGNR